MRPEGGLSRREFLTRVGLGATGLAAAAILQPYEAHAEAASTVATAPPYTLTAVAGRPTDRSVALNIISTAGGAVAVDCGTASGRYDGTAVQATCAAGIPAEVSLTGLRPDTDYFYRVRSPDGAGPEQHFHTGRPPGSSFTFEIQGDSHPERPNMYDATLYAQTLRAAAADQPDFYMTIGDDFSVDHYQGLATPAQVDAIYRYQRACLSLVGVPVFLVNGNHEQAAMCNLDGTADSIAVLAGTSRNRYFAVPAPDDFYSGDAKPVEHVGLLRDYYSWTWGDALFVVIDPYWHSPMAVDNPYAKGQKTRELWAVTYGEDQYRWLDRTLAQSRAKYKFVFSHHVLGTGRGGIEVAGLCEWGGYSRRGDWGFPVQRPGWDMPIHQLLAKTGVTIFFQGHDHVFARQTLDGVTYQTLPVPADPYYAWGFAQAYQSGDILPCSGRLRVTVAPEKVRVAYVRSYLPQHATAAHPDGEIAYRYEVPSRSLDQGRQQ